MFHTTIDLFPKGERPCPVPNPNIITDNNVLI